MKVLACFALCLLSLACQRRLFVNVGNGQGIPVQAIDQYAREHGVTRQEAKDHFRREAEAEKAKSDAASATP